MHTEGQDAKFNESRRGYLKNKNMKGFITLVTEQKQWVNTIIAQHTE